MLSDIYECVNLHGKKVTKIVLNVPEPRRESTKDIETRLSELQERPLMPLEKFTTQKGVEYIVVPTTARKSVLVEFLKNIYQLRFSQLIHPTAYLSLFAKIGQGVFIGTNSLIQLSGNFFYCQNI